MLSRQFVIKLRFRSVFKNFLIGGRGGGLVDRAADSGPYDPSSIPLGEKKDNKQKRIRGWPVFQKKRTFIIEEYQNKK